ncbi:hypothetical protein jhhlp_002234 [Lomentospora prolificans]|uniref:Arrestin-like N-terminal domain-containing protein n=1 Tax=Lomentospora prolificans TaxID=41688 RepID=A0A2N3NDP9_9PEZI|nr:hypothetical protein jhhlp_002234 [Lomentospora prolificans]
MALPSEKATALRESLSRALLDQLTEALLSYHSVDQLSAPVLRFEAFIEDGHNNGENATTDDNPWSRQPIVSRSMDLSDLLSWSARSSNTLAHTSISQPPSQTRKSIPAQPGGAVREQGSSRSMTSVTTNDTRISSDTARRKTLSVLRPSRGIPSVTNQEDSHRQIQISDRNFPKRSKGLLTAPVPQESSLRKFIISVWEQIHGGLSLEPQSLVEQWKVTAAVTTASMGNAGGPLSHPALFHTPTQMPATPPSSVADDCSTPLEDGNTAFSQRSQFCRNVTQAGRTGRSVEVIVQAKWIEHFNAYVDFLCATHRDMSPTKCRKAALIKACTEFGWSERELRNKMAVWRGYKEIKDVGGWVALVFSGMGLYRLCKYRVGFNNDGLRQLMASRARFEVAADTLHPNWRQLLAIVGEKPDGYRFTGHPHDWVVHQDGSEPVHLSSTYLAYDPHFRFEHLDESVMDTNAWGTDDPRWMPPPLPAASTTARSGSVIIPDRCDACGMEQSDDPKINNCYCFPSLFRGPRSRPPVQVFHTTNGKRNGVQALVQFPRGTAIGEFVGLITKGIEGSDVLILDSTHLLNPSAFGNGNGELSKGHLQIPFRLQFPIPNRSQFYAPPSLDIREAELRATVAYSIRVEITTPSLVRSKLVYKHAITFRPPSHVVLHRHLSLPTTSAHAMVAANNLNPGVLPPYQAPYLPQYCPALRVGVEFPSPNILYIGQPVAMELDVAVTEDLISCLGTIRLRKLQISLTATTSVHSGPASREISSPMTLCSVNCDYPLAIGVKEGTCRVDRALWSNRLIPELPISFSSYNVSRSYTMDVLVGFSSGKRENIECVAMTSTVYVWCRSDLPPEYSSDGYFLPNE